MNLLDSLFGAFVLMAIMVTLYNLGSWLNKGQEAESASWQMQTVADAASQYVRDNRATLLADTNLTMTVGKNLGIADLKTAGYLNTGFPEKDIWGQPFKIYIRRRSSDTTSQMYNSLQIITAARDIPDAHGWNGSEGARIDFVRDKILEAALRTPGCGYIPVERLRTIYGITETTLYCPKKQWTLDVAEKYGVNDLKEGSLAIVSSYTSTDSGLKPDYLYRKAVEDHPELNQMETALDMNSHSIANITSLQLTPIGKNKFFYNGALRTEENLEELCTEASAEGLIFLDAEKGIYVCRNGALAMVHDTKNAVQVKRMDIVANNALVDKPTCPPGLEAHIYASAVSTAEGEDVTPIQAFQTWATNQNDTQWQVHHRLNTTGSGEIEPTGGYVRILAITTCMDPGMSY